MRVLFISYGHIDNPFLPGGGALRMHKFAEYLQEKNFNVVYLTGAFPKKLKNYKYELVQIGNGNTPYISLANFSMKLPMFVFKHRNDFDIILEDFSPFYASLAPLVHKKTIVQLQIYIGRENFRRFIFPLNIAFFMNERYYIKLFDNAVFVSEFLQKVFMYRKRYRVIWSGVDEENFKYQCEESNFLLYIGRISKYMKGLDVLFSAIKELKKYLKEKNLFVAIVGDGPDRSYFERFAEDNELPVKFFGWISSKQRIAELYSKCIFNVLPSRYEGFGLSILEAASFCKTSIISNIPAFLWALPFCITFERENSEDLSDKIRKLVSDKDLRVYLGTLGRKFAETKTWGRVSEEFKDFVLEVAHQR